VQIASDVIDLIGNTPLLHLKHVSEKTGCTILGKAEFLNPGGSVKDCARECGQFFSTERWLGGTLTNFKTIKNSIKRMKEIEKMDSDGSINAYVKQEQSMLRREHARLHKYLDGIRDLEQFPDAVFIVDLKREHNAVAEARKLKIPVVAIVDTNCDPDLVDYPIPANDDAIRSIKVILNAVTAAVSKGRAEHEARYARSRKPDEQAAETPGSIAVTESAPAAEPAAVNTAQA